VDQSCPRKPHSQANCEILEDTGGVEGGGGEKKTNALCYGKTMNGTGKDWKRLKSLRRESCGRAEEGGELIGRGVRGGRGGGVGKREQRMKRRKVRVGTGVVGNRIEPW